MTRLFPTLAFFCALAALSVAPRDAAAQCTDTCAYAHDGRCSDGGPGSVDNVCGFAADCYDCGPRVAPAVKSDIFDLTLQEELYYLINEINYYVTTNGRELAACGLAEISLEPTRDAVNEALNETPTDELLNCLDAVANLMDCIATLECSTMGEMDALCSSHFDNVNALCQ